MAIITQTTNKTEIMYSGAIASGYYNVPIIILSSGTTFSGGILSGIAVCYYFNNSSGIQYEKVQQLRDMALDCYNRMV
jgi:hypothetical protein